VTIQIPSKAFYPKETKKPPPLLLLIFFSPHRVRTTCNRLLLLRHLGPIPNRPPSKFSFKNRITFFLRLIPTVLRRKVCNPPFQLPKCPSSSCSPQLKGRPALSLPFLPVEIFFSLQFLCPPLFFLPFTVRTMNAGQHSVSYRRFLIRCDSCCSLVMSVPASFSVPQLDLDSFRRIPLRCFSRMPSKSFSFSQVLGIFLSDLPSPFTFSGISTFSLDLLKFDRRLDFLLSRFPDHRPFFLPSLHLPLSPRSL